MLGNMFSFLFSLQYSVHQILQDLAAMWEFPLALLGEL